MVDLNLLLLCVHDCRCQDQLGCILCTRSQLGSVQRAVDTVKCALLFEVNEVVINFSC